MFDGQCRLPPAPHDNQSRKTSWEGKFFFEYKSGFHAIRIHAERFRTYFLHYQILLNKAQQETNKIFHLAFGLNSFNFHDRENVGIGSQFQNLEHHPGWPLLYFTVSLTASVIDHFCLSLLCRGPEAVFGFAAAASTRCSGPEEIMWAASGLRLKDTLVVNRQRDEAPATVTRYFGCLFKVLLVCGRFPTRQLSSLVSPDAEETLSSQAVTKCRSDSRAAMELLGRMQRSPEKLLWSNAWKHH